VHYDGQIWSQALWGIRKGYEASGRTTRAWDTTLVDSQFDYAIDTSFSAAAKATYAQAASDCGRDMSPPRPGRGGPASLVKDRFAARGITF